MKSRRATSKNNWCCRYECRVADLSEATHGSHQTRWQTLVARFDAYERLIRLDKPIGILLLLWPTLSALWIAADGRPSWKLIMIFTMGTIVMRSAGCAIN